MKPGKPCRSMTERAQEYLDYRRNLGYRLDGLDRHLLQFARWADDRGYRGPVTTALAMQWATIPATAKPYHARRLTAVRCFARYCVLFDPATERWAVLVSQLNDALTHAASSRSASTSYKILKLGQPS